MAEKLCIIKNRSPKQKLIIPNIYLSGGCFETNAEGEGNATFTLNVKNYTKIRLGGIRTFYTKNDVTGLDYALVLDGVRTSMVFNTDIDITNVNELTFYLWSHIYRGSGGEWRYGKIWIDNIEIS